MAERDVLDVLRDMCNTIDYALASGVSPAYPDTSIRSVIGRAAAALAEARAEVDSLSESYRASAARADALCAERDESRAEVERLRQAV